MLARPLPARGTELPRNACMVAWLFVTAGVLAAAEVTWHVAHGTFMFDLELLFLLVGYGLLRQSELARTCALGVAGLYAALATLGAALLLAGPPPHKVDVLGYALPPQATAATIVAAGACLSIALVAGFTIRTLTRNDTRRCFATS